MATKWQSHTLDDVRKALNGGRLVIITGAGVSLSATAGDVRITWPGLIEVSLLVLDRLVVV
jgi:hypothetical protein